MQHGQWTFNKVGRIEKHLRILTLRRAYNRKFVLRRMLRRKGVKHAGNVQRNARAHQHLTYARQHGSIDRWQMRQLHLL